MSVITDKLDTLGALVFWGKKGIRFYPVENFEDDCDAALASINMAAKWWFDGETGKIEFDYLVELNTREDLKSFDDAKDSLKKVIINWLNK